MSKAQSAHGKGKRGERRDDILAAARQLFVTRGHGKTTMAEIAQAIGVAEGTVYLYFPSKQELVVAVAVEWFQEIASATEREAQAIHDIRDRLHFLIQRHLDVILNNPALYLTLVRELRADDSYAASRGRDVNRAYTGLLRGALRDAAAAGLLASPLDAGVMRDLVYGGVEHVAWSAIIRGDGATMDTAGIAAGIADSFARGFGITPALPDPVEARLRAIEARLDGRYS